MRVWTLLEHIHMWLVCLGLTLSIRSSLSSEEGDHLSFSPKERPHRRTRTLGNIVSLLYLLSGVSSLSCWNVLKCALGWWVPRWHPPQACSCRARVIGHELKTTGSKILQAGWSGLMFLSQPLFLSCLKPSVFSSMSWASLSWTLRGQFG